MVWQLVNGGFINLPRDFFDNYLEVQAERELESARILRKRIDGIKAAQAKQDDKDEWWPISDEPSTPKIIEDAQLLKDYVRGNPPERAFPEADPVKFVRHINKRRDALTKMYHGSTWRAEGLTPGILKTLKAYGIVHPPRELAYGRWTTDLTSKAIRYLGLEGGLT